MYKTYNKPVLLVVVFSAIFLVPGCVKRMALPQKESDDTVVIDRKEFLAMARAQAGDSALVADSIMYKADVLYPGDQVGITIYEKLPASSDKRLEIKKVDGRGMIWLLPMGTIKIGGLTTMEAEKFIEEQLKQYYKSPYIELTVTEREIGRQQVYLFGAGSSQGSFVIHENYRIIDLFAAAGGVSTSILARPVKLIRQNEDKVVMTTIDLNDIIKRGQFEKNVRLQNQDIVYVPRAFLATSQEIFGVISSLLPWYYFALLFSGTGK